MLRETGVRIGEALGLRHEDLDTRRRVVAVVGRENVNRARAKTWSREIPAGAELFRLYSDYLHEEYGLLDCDYVFVNLWGPPVGAPMSYASVDRMVRRLRTRTGIGFSPHLFRHILRHPADQQRSPAGDRPAAARSRLSRHDLPLRQAVGHHHPRAMGTSPEGHHHRPDRGRRLRPARGRGLG